VSRSNTSSTHGRHIRNLKRSFLLNLTMPYQLQVIYQRTYIPLWSSRIYYSLLGLWELHVLLQV